MSKKKKTETKEEIKAEPRKKFEAEVVENGKVKVITIDETGKRIRKELFNTPLKTVQMPNNPGMDFGIDETMDVVEFGVSFANAIIKTFEDGKVSLSDIPFFVPPVVKLPSAISGLDMVPAELSDIDEAELQQIINYVKNELDVDDAKAKAIAEAAIKAAYAVYELLKTIKE